jgi:hypothetical protein
MGPPRSSSYEVTIAEPVRAMAPLGRSTIQSEDSQSVNRGSGQTRERYLPQPHSRGSWISRCASMISGHARGRLTTRRSVASNGAVRELRPGSSAQTTE